MNYSVGRYIFGLAMVATGLCAWVWHDVANVPHLKAFAGAHEREILAYIVGTVEILGGLAILSAKTARFGGAAVGALFCIFA